MMPTFSPVYDAFLMLLGLSALVLGALIPGPLALKGYLILFGLVLLGWLFSRVFLALHILERRSTLFDPPDPGEEVPIEPASEDRFRFPEDHVVEFKRKAA